MLKYLIVMGIYRHIKEAWDNPKEGLGKLYQERLIQWRRNNSVVKLDRPTRLDRARGLGYKAKEGIFVVRVRVGKGGRKRRGSLKNKRKSRRATARKVLSKSYQVVAEQRADKKYVNAEVLNSYWVGEDGKHKWYEIIMVIPSHPAIKNDNELSWISSEKHRGRVWRGLTSAGKKSRGLRNKGKGAEKVRPSSSANLRRRSE